ncbi:MAG: hypothetical protein RQ885_00720 [Desulfurococcales archaeon]|jgi:hypothetical protein|nr:hypothetical protein [Desulfurococcales archaeon]
MKIDYEARTIRITLRQGEYLYISWGISIVREKGQGWGVGEDISGMTW